MGPVEKCLRDSGIDKRKITDVVLVGGSTRIPKVQQLIQEFFNGKEPNRSINPDEAVAYGAAVQAAIVSGTGSADVQNMLLLDVAPLSLGIEMHGGVLQKLIERNSTIPTNKSQEFTTTQDYQEEVEIKVYEGERTLVKDNNYLGKFIMKGLPKTLRGVPKVTVTFNIDSEGILTVTAEDKKNDLRNSIQIENEKGRLSKVEIERMLAEAEQYKHEDGLTREEVIARESLKGYLVRIRKSLDDFEESKLPASDKERITKKMQEVEEWLRERGERSSKQECERKQKEMEAAWNVIMVRVHQGLDDFWDRQVEQADSKAERVLVENGGFYLRNGFDLRELMDDPD